MAASRWSPASFGLALLDSPTQLHGLLSDQILCALRTHLACRYAVSDFPIDRPQDCPKKQIQRLRSPMLDDLSATYGWKNSRVLASYRWPNSAGATKPCSSFRLINGAQRAK
jgi:hypothetical protein